MYKFKKEITRSKAPEVQDQGNQGAGKKKKKSWWVFPVKEESSRREAKQTQEVRLRVKGLELRMQWNELKLELENSGKDTSTQIARLRK